MPSAANRATSVQPSLATGGVPTAATKSRGRRRGQAGQRARRGVDAPSTSNPANTSRRWASACVALDRSGANRKLTVDLALVRDDVAGHAAADADRVEPLAVVAAVDRRPRAARTPSSRRSTSPARVDRVDAEPGAGACARRPVVRTVGPHRALAARLDQPVGRLQQDREVGRQPVRVLARATRPRPLRSPRPPRSRRRQVRDVVGRVGHGDRPGAARARRRTSCRRCRSRTAGHRPRRGREVVGDRHGVQVPGQHHPARPAERGAGQHHVADPLHRRGAGAPRSAASTASAIACSSPETDSMSTSARVSATGSARPRRSRSRRHS